MINRYTLPRMRELWSQENKYRKWLEVELLACEANASMGKIPKSALAKIKKKAKFDPKRIEQIEKKTRHDLLAFVTNVGEYVGENSKYIHLGLTSYDVVDTALSVLLREAGEILLADLRSLSQQIKKKALKYKYAPMIGRTHGVHAEPITLGLKFALWYAETERNIQRLQRAIEIISVGKISGSVGNYAHVDPQVERYVCKKLKLKPASVSSQILQRDRHAELLTTLAIIASSVEKFATEIRNLQRTEILEMEEGFARGQKGSSSMPHKRNPITCERLSGLARVIRGYALSSLENIALWHERDLTDSSVERVILPDSTTLLDYMLIKFIQILKNLSIYPENMLKNLEKTRGLIFSQRILMELTPKIGKEKAYQVVQSNAMKTWNTDKSFKELLKKDKRLAKAITEKELEECFDLKYYIKFVDHIFKRVFRSN
jgi:adenylosuccinate lyase